MTSLHAILKRLLTESHKTHRAHLHQVRRDRGCILMNGAQRELWADSGGAPAGPGSIWGPRSCPVQRGGWDRESRSSYKPTEARSVLSRGREKCLSEDRVGPGRALEVASPGVDAGRPAGLGPSGQGG